MNPCWIVLVRNIAECCEVIRVVRQVLGNEKGLYQVTNRQYRHNCARIVLKQFLQEEEMTTGPFHTHNQIQQIRVESLRPRPHTLELR
jgi:hypothetical protein